MRKLLNLLKRFLSSSFFEFLFYILIYHFVVAPLSNHATTAAEFFVIICLCKLIDIDRALRKQKSDTPN